jgi:hypothetical protein
MDSGWIPAFGDIFHAVPWAGIFPPHTETNLTLLFEPPVVPEHDQDDIFHGSVGKRQIMESGEQFPIQLNGEAVRLSVTFSHVDLNFGCS